MGELVSKVCCFNNLDIIQNQSIFTLNSECLEKKYSSLIQKTEEEKQPVSVMKLKDSEIHSELSLTSRYVIIKKEGSPLNDYEVLDKLGEGTFGKVYKVRNKATKKIRALKEIGIFNLSNIRKKNIMKEIEILKKLNHIYIIKLYEYYITEDYIYLINELSTEGDLQSKKNKIRIFPEFVVKMIMLQIFKALMYLNEKNIIHGDLKLENILVVSYNDNENIKSEKINKKQDGFIEAIKHDMKIIDDNLFQNSNTNRYKKDGIKLIDEFNKKIQEDKRNIDIKKHNTNIKFGNHFHFLEKNEQKQNIQEKLLIKNYGIKLIDFGCSKIFTKTKKNFNDTIGTLVYCAPEVISGDYNKFCDIWSCGVIMYYLLSGNFPFKGEDENETIEKILEGKYEFDVEYFNNISEEAKDLIKECLISEPDKRIPIQQALKHKFFKDILENQAFTENEKIQLKNLKKLKHKNRFYQLVLTYLSYNFSDNKLLNELNKLYDKLDKNTDYKITKSELYKSFKEANIPITPQEMENIINSMDFNNSGDIDYEEFIRICIPKEKLFTEENLKNAFSMFDVNKKGFITPQIIIDFIESTRQITEKLKEEIKSEIVDVADEIIDYDSFRYFMLNL